MLSTAEDRRDKLYVSYSNKDCYKDEHLFYSSPKGRFQDLSMRLAIGIKNEVNDDFISLFTWSEVEVQELNMLRCGTIMEKNIHLFYLIEITYSLALDIHQNISSQSGCEWQLNLK